MAMSTRPVRRLIAWGTRLTTGDFLAMGQSNPPRAPCNDNRAPFTRRLAPRIQGFSASASRLPCRRGSTVGRSLVLKTVARLGRRGRRPKPEAQGPKPEGSRTCRLQRDVAVLLRGIAIALGLERRQCRRDLRARLPGEDDLIDEA